MPRTKSLNPTVPRQIRLPSDLNAKVDIYLTSTIEGRIPLGELSAFIVPLIERFFRELAEAQQGAGK